MKKIIGFLMSGILIFSFFSCGEDLGESGIKIPELDTTSVTGRYVYNNYTVPYNIGVLYKWVHENSDLSKNLIAPQEAKVVPFMDMVKDIWLDAYLTQVDSSFLKWLTPKEMLLIGSASYNSDGTITQGTADAGKKITLYEINKYEPNSASAPAQVLGYAHVIHHEFAHIMHQHIKFSDDYKTITPEYTSSWYLLSNDEAYAKGFITNYAMSSFEEDFVEMVSCMLTTTPEIWRARIDKAPNESARKALLNKESIMRDYMINTWGINMESFQKLMTQKLKGSSYLEMPGTNANSPLLKSAALPDGKDPVFWNIVKNYSSLSCFSALSPSTWVIRSYHVK